MVWVERTEAISLVPISHGPYDRRNEKAAGTNPAALVDCPYAAVTETFFSIQALIGAAPPG